MLTDEKIALLERQKRQWMREKREKTYADREMNGREKEPAMTLAEAVKGVGMGRLELESGEVVEFEPYIIEKYDIPVVILKDFYTSSEEKENSAVFANQEREVSQMLTWKGVEKDPETVGQWKELLASGMETSEIFIKVLREEELEYLDYICYETPTGKGWFYNLIFRVRRTDVTLMGNYNCLETDRSTYGIVLESMIRTLNEVIKNRSGGKEI